MVAYSFKQQFIRPILAGTKQQTIRAPRTGRSRHARPGETLQLYTAMRTKYCTLIGRAKCLSITPVTINLPHYIVTIGDETFAQKWDWLNDFAKADGFPNWKAMWDFWWKTHPKEPFSGMLIRWDALQIAPAGRSE